MIGLLFCFFKMTCFISNVVLSSFVKRMAYFNLKCLLVYTMKIQKYKRTFSLRKYASNNTQYGVKILCSYDIVFMII
jgi:hypothetical protein